MKEVETSAAKAAADPAYAARIGVAPMRATPLLDHSGDRRTTPIMSTQGDWLRGAVAALLPAGEPYEVVEGMDGRAHLILTGRGRR